MRGNYAYNRPVENAFLVRERARGRVRELVRVVAVLLPLGLALLGYTWVHLEVLDTGYRINALERRLDGLTREERELRLEAAYLESPRQIEERAAGELGMAPPALGQVLFWREVR